MLQRRLGTLQTLDSLYPLSIVWWLVFQFHLRSLNREEHDLQREPEEPWLQAAMALVGV